MRSVGNGALGQHHHVDDVDLVEGRGQHAVDEVEVDRLCRGVLEEAERLTFGALDGRLAAAGSRSRGCAAATAGAGGSSAAAAGRGPGAAPGPCATPRRRRGRARRRSGRATAARCPRPACAPSAAPAATAVPTRASEPVRASSSRARPRRRTRPRRLPRRRRPCRHRPRRQRCAASAAPAHSGQSPPSATASRGVRGAVADGRPGVGHEGGGRPVAGRGPSPSTPRRRPRRCRPSHGCPPAATLDRPEATRRTGRPRSARARCR